MLFKWPAGLSAKHSDPDALEVVQGNGEILGHMGILMGLQECLVSWGRRGAPLQPGYKGAGSRARAGVGDGNRMGQASRRHAGWAGGGKAWPCLPQPEIRD